jgi:hypothetical protein
MIYAVKLLNKKIIFKKKAFLIMTFTLHGWNRLLNCYNSIRKFYKNSIIIIVNNHNYNQSNCFEHLRAIEIPGLTGNVIISNSSLCFLRITSGVL